MWQGDKSNPVPNIGKVSSDLSQEIAEQSSNLSEKKADVNRAYQTRRDTDKQKDNTVTLIDTDSAIIHHLENLQLTIVDEGNKIKVPIYYASPEKWKSIQKDGVIRDYNGKMILPAIVFQRTTSETDEMMKMFNRHLTYPVIRTYSEKNRYTRFSNLIGENVPVHEVYNVVLPRHMVFTYHFIIWTEYIEQMNTLVERFSFETGNSTYWGNLRGLRFRTKLDTFNHTVELQVDQDRLVKTEFDLMINGYLLPDIMGQLDGSSLTTQKWFTPKKIIIGTEVVATDFDMEKLDPNREKWRSQFYPNLPADEVISKPPITFPHITVSPFQTPATSSLWHFPAPQNSSDFGVPGWISYDEDYYYIFPSIEWKRAPIVLVDEISAIVSQKKWTSFDQDYIYMSGSLDRIPISLFNNFL
jgi:hypothetical protein